VPAHNGERQ